MRIIQHRRTVGAVVGTLLAVGVTSSALSVPSIAKPLAPSAANGTATIVDAKNDVTPGRLDIRKVTVTNTSEQLRIRVSFPGQDHVYDFPLGAISVFLDTSKARSGPEFGHFMDFWSDYRFAPTRNWREQRVRPWMHSPDGRCVQYAGLSSDSGSRLRWFEYVVKKTKGCFSAKSVRVAVTSITTGTKEPTHYYSKPRYDHLGAKHRWSAWIPEARS